MSAQIQFFAGNGGVQINNLSGSGLGLYNSAGFSSSIPVGSWNGRTFITDSTGTVAGSEANNNQYLTNSTVIYGQQGSGNNLLTLPNYLSTLNIHFTNSSSVQTQNVTLYGYDRVSFSNPPSGVNLQVAEIIHPGVLQNLTGSGSTTWFPLGSGGGTLALAGGPGTSGQHINGVLTSDFVHDWFIAISASPTSVGAKLFSTAVSLEFL